MTAIVVILFIIHTCWLLLLTILVDNCLSGDTKGEDKRLDQIEHENKAVYSTLTVYVDAMKAFNEDVIDRLNKLEELHNWDKDE